ncbi:hypothetical protein [Kribbella sp. NPDC023855]|uniref:hypothetical protein n=1 Tax=Kribbella sp. NPDC023855 TaxID=3154698 RepID=UPI0033D5413E
MSGVFGLVGALSTVSSASAENIVHDKVIPHQVASAPAVGVASAFNDQLQVVRLPDNRIVYSISNDATAAGVIRGWAEIPGGGRTERQLAVHHNKKLGKTYVAAIGMGGFGMFLQTIDWNTGAWANGWTYYGGEFSSPPEIAVNDQKGIITLLGSGRTDSRLYYKNQLIGQPTDSSNLTWKQWGSPFTTKLKVAARWVGGKTPAGAEFSSLRIAATQDGHGLIYNAQGTLKNSKEFNTNSVWFEVPGGGKTNHGLSMAEWDNDLDGYADTLWLAVRGVNDGFAYQTYQANQWNGVAEAGDTGPGWRWFQTQGNSPFGPAMYTRSNGPVLAVTETQANGGGIVYQRNIGDLKPGPRSLAVLKNDPAQPGWTEAKISEPVGTGYHPQEISAGWKPSWKDSNGSPVPSPVNGPNAVQNSEPVNKWYPWCAVYKINDVPTGQRAQHWMPGENQNSAFADLVAWLDVHYPLGEDQLGWIEENGPC